VTPKKQPPFRYLQALNKAHLASLAAAGVLVVLPACGNGDEDAFSSTTLSAETIASVVESSIPVTTLAAGPVVPASTQMTVDFTYSADSTDGRVLNPYIAVWVEDKDGNLVQTISVWFMQGEKGQRYLQHLSSWNTLATESNAEVSTSGATRPAGTYSVVWDGTGIDGGLVAEGEYVLYIESAREHGPHSISSVPIVLGAEGVSVVLPDDGELSAMAATVTV
jgi:hypothetical protein